MTERIETRTWRGFELESLRVGSAPGVPCHVLWPSTSVERVPFVLATHGATSSKHEWTECDGYTKGGNLGLELLAAGIAVVAMDWHYHGDNDTRDLGGRNVFEPAHFADFFDRSVLDARQVLAFAAAHPRLDATRKGFAGYSLGATFGFWLASHGESFAAMLLCVPGVGRDPRQTRSAANNLGGLADTAILQVGAEHDEYIPFDDSRWLFERIPARSKRFLSYPSGHSLPAEYVPLAADFLREGLLAAD